MRTNILVTRGAWVEADLRRTEALVSARLAGDLDHTVSLGGDIPPLGAVVEVERDLVHSASIRIYRSSAPALCLYHYVIYR